MVQIVVYPIKIIIMVNFEIFFPLNILVLLPFFVSLKFIFSSFYFGVFVLGLNNYESSSIFNGEFDFLEYYFYFFFLGLFFSEIGRGAISDFPLNLILSWV